MGRGLSGEDIGCPSTGELVQGPSGTRERGWVSRNGTGPAGQQRTAAEHEDWSATIASNNKRTRAGQPRTAADSSGQQPSTEDAQQGVEKTGLWLCGAGRPALPRPRGPLRLVRGVRRWLAGFFGPLESARLPAVGSCLGARSLAGAPGSPGCLAGLLTPTASGVSRALAGWLNTTGPVRPVPCGWLSFCRPFAGCGSGPASWLAEF